MLLRRKTAEVLALQTVRTAQLRRTALDLYRVEMRDGN